MGAAGAAAVRTAEGAGLAVVAGHMEDLAAVGEARPRLLVAADLVRVAEALRVTALATVVAAITATRAAAVDIGGIRFTADPQLRRRLLKAACLRETSSRSRTQPGLQNILPQGTILGWSRLAHRRAQRHA